MCDCEEIIIGSGRSGEAKTGKPYKIIRRNGRPAIVYDGKIWILEDMTDEDLKQYAPAFIRLIQKEKQKERKKKERQKAKQPMKNKNPAQRIISSAATSSSLPAFTTQLYSTLDIRSQVDQIKKDAEKEKQQLREDRKRAEESEKLKGEELARLRLETAAKIKEAQEAADVEIAKIKGLAGISEDVVAAQKKELMDAAELALEDLKREYEEKIADLPTKEDLEAAKAAFEAEKNELIDKANEQIAKLEERLASQPVEQLIDLPGWIREVQERVDKDMRKTSTRLTISTPANLMDLRVPGAFIGENIRLADGKIATIATNGSINLDGVKTDADKDDPRYEQILEGLYRYAYKPIDENNVWKYAEIYGIQPKRLSTGSGRMGKDSLSNLEIDEFAADAEIEDYLPAMPVDRLPELNGQTAVFIMNTEPSTGDRLNGHWIAIRVNEDDSVEYFDPLGELPPKEFWDWLDEEDIYGQVKVSQTKLQSDNSSTCGFFALKFLIDRQNGKSFKEATGFDRIEKLIDLSPEFEKTIRPFIKEFRQQRAE